MDRHQGSDHAYRRFAPPVPGHGRGPPLELQLVPMAAGVLGRRRLSRHGAQTGMCRRGAEDPATAAKVRLQWTYLGYLGGRGLRSENAGSSTIAGAARK
jgi:hypothetical protein